MPTTLRAITMPKWGIEMQEGTITDWHATVGQRLAKADPLLDVETDKIVNTVESPFDGTLRRVVAEKGDTLAVGALLAIYAEPSVSDGEIDAFIKAFRPVDASFEPGDSGASTAAAPAAVATEPLPPSAAPEVESRVSPIARRLAERLGIDLAHVRGTGPNGRISKEDVETFAARASAAATAGAPANPSKREAMTSMRLAIARRLLDSKQGIPHYRLERTIEASALTQRRAELKAAGATVSLNDLIVRACALALGRHPRVNAHLIDQEVVSFENADVCIAVASDQGLLTPVVRAANLKSAEEIATITQDLAARARAGKLVREEISGGTFTVSNLGMYGLDRFDAIINPPQVAILAVGAVRDAPVVRNGAVVAGKLLTLTLSCDHRVVDGAAGALFLASVAELLGAPGPL